MSDAAPPPWVRQLTIPSGQWRCLVGLWGFARYQTKGQTTVYPCRETLAEQTGQTVHAVAKQLRQLAAAGWIHRPGKRGSTKAVLAWAEPFGQDGPAASQDGPPRTEVSPETDGSGEETGRSEVDPGRSDGWTQDGPQTSRELQENFQENVGDAAATPDPQPTRETRHERHENHRDAEAPRRAPGADARDDRQVPQGVGSATGANPHLDTTAPQHAALAAERRKPDNRADLSPEVDAAVRAGGMGSQLAGVVWRRCLLEALDDIGVGEDEHAAMVAKVLEHWQNTRPGDKPAKSQVWYRRWRDWQREAMGLGSVRKSKDNMSGGLVPMAAPRNGYETRAQAKARMDLEAAQGAA